MSRRRPLHRYPERYYLLFEEAQKRVVTIPFATVGKAATFRVELYNLRAQVREALAADPTLDSLGEHLLMMENIEIRLRGTTLQLHKKTDPHAHALEIALNGQDA